MEKVFTINKERGETSLQALERLRSSQNIASIVPMTYAGTLDPMAEGLLLILTGEECKNKAAYTKLDKTYEVEILFGVSTDTGDILGLINKSATSTIYRTSIENVLPSFLGRRTLPYHHFSHKHVGGKPLFQHAKDNTLSKIEIPEKEIEIKSIKLLSTGFRSVIEIQKGIERDVPLVTGDFRQEKILGKWNKFFKNPRADFSTATIEVNCSSGTYMRTLVEEIGEKLRTPALAYKIVRVSIDNFANKKPLEN